MFSRLQKTITRPISLNGIGVHTGLPTSLILKPYEPNGGIRFHCAQTHQVLKADVSLVKDVEYATTLGSHQKMIRTVEHLMAACHGLGIDNLLVEIHGEEIPIYDGSAAPFVNAITSAGIIEQTEEKLWMVIKKEVSLYHEDRFIRISPYSEPLWDVTISLFQQRHHHQFSSWRHSFAADISLARTFCLLKDVRHLMDKALIKGGTLDCAVVLDDQGKPINAEGLRYSNECVRHKLLDMMGDFKLLGKDVLGKIEAHQPGHALNYRFMKTLLEQPDAYEILSSSQLYGKNIRKKLGAAPS